MALSLETYSLATDYIVRCLENDHINATKLALCQWIIKRVADGTITVMEETR